MIVSKFIVEVSFTVVTYDRQNMFIIQATGFSDAGKTLFSPPIFFHWISNFKQKFFFIVSFETEREGAEIVAVVLKKVNLIKR
jgi:hypothetical protein